MDNLFISEAKIVSNSAKDGTVKVKMATVGERNLNGFLLSNDKSLKFKSNASYPLFFEHKTDMDNLIGFFTPIGVEGKDIMANAKITNPRAKELVSNGAINSASVTYEVEDYELEVGSAGLTAPFKVLQQYLKNVGNEVEVLTADGRKFTGILQQVDSTTGAFTVAVPTKVKHEGQKRPVIEDVPYDLTPAQCKYVKYNINFK